MNHNIRKVLEAIEILREVQGCELEVSSLSHKVQAMYLTQDKEGLEGVPFIDACSDEELIAALVMKDRRTRLYPHMCPFTFNYLRRNRMNCLLISDRIRCGNG